MGRSITITRTMRKTVRQHVHFLVLLCVFFATTSSFTALLVYSWVLFTCTSMASSISPWELTNKAISLNICARSCMLCSSRRMSLCLSRMRCTSSRITAWAPAIFRMTICEEVSPASIISCTSCSVASGQRSCISRACCLSSMCFKSSCAFWKSSRSCWCFFSMACCMFARIRHSAEPGLSLSSASDLAWSSSSCSLALATWRWTSSTCCARRSDTVFWRSCVVACRASSSILPMASTPSRPNFRVA
mmetsp:Transcript_118232/g.314626  ORF Transcript_118232/g.314626 Transcript_118232/m.314626 type:complete len:247 (-) Transcript_118232:349-1089(-)